ncbi:protein kinase [Cystobacter fuscus]|uniref:protein kinase domain-containing protein n=1 Tax=Cystobacter fuscus TaxID=43 RepID=UPI002B2A9519|nr:protein kinase [Cystobacter fuscus]
MGPKGLNSKEEVFLRKVIQVSTPPRLPFPGMRLGGPDDRRFEIIGWLGLGGMSQVFRARDTKLQREVALKILVPRQGHEDAALKEARSVARLDHENIIKIFDVGMWRDTAGRSQTPFLVTEYLEGESLASLLRRERPSLQRTLEIMDAVAAGLAHAHERHLVHRDLKPSNVFLTRQGTVKLLDFGIAHLIAVDSPRIPDLPTSGTPAYMAPEQWLGERQDPRTDVWSAGVMIHEMLTGQLPYSSSTLGELRTRVTSTGPAPSVRACCPELPQEVEDFLSAALTKKPARRFPTALELRQELRELRVHLGFQPAEPRPEVPQRRQMTLMCCQLVGRGDLGEQFDEEALGEVEAAFLRGCSEVIQQQGGAVFHSMRGEVHAWFGHLQTRENDAERAVRAGLHLIGSVREELSRRVPELPRSGLAVKVGIQTDMVTLGVNASDPGSQTLNLLGETPKVTAWLAAQASPGELLLGESSYKLVRGAFELEPLGPRSFEGLWGGVSVEIHRVLRERSTRVRFDRAVAAGGLSLLVGREQEQQRLREHWEQARRGQGAFVVIQGDAGIGKSRLIRELTEQVSQEPAMQLQFQCWSQLYTSELHPIVQVLQRLFQLPEEGTPQQQLEELEERLGALGMSSEEVHVLGMLLSLPLPEDSAIRRFTPERRKEKLFSTLGTLLLRVAQVQPVLLTIEDLHWADSILMEFLGFLLERIEQAHVLVLLSTRPGLQVTWPQRPWRHWLPLEHLSAGSAALLVKEVARDRHLPEETLQQLVSKTDGIPLFIEEMTRMVLEQPTAHEDWEGGLPRAIPVTLSELLLARLDRLAPRQKELIQLCAVVGRDFTHQLLAAVAERDDDSLKRGLSGLMEMQLLQARPGVLDPSYQFRHALIQEAAYQSLSRRLRRRYHRHIAAVMTERFPWLVLSKPEVLAHHYTKAGENERAIPYWAQAGLRARMRSAPVEAVSHLTQALKLLRGLPDAPQRLRDELQFVSTLGDPLTYIQGFCSPEVERTYARARELLRQIGETLPTLEPSYWEVCTYYLARAKFHYLQELAEQLVQCGTSQHDEETRALGYRLMATVFLCWGQVRTASEYLERAEACARSDLEPHRPQELRQGIAPVLAALAYAPIIHSVCGRPEQARHYSDMVIALARQVGHPHTTACALTWVAVACQFRGDAPGALTWANKVIDSCSERSYSWAWQTWSMFIKDWARSEKGEEHPQERLDHMRQLDKEWRSRGIRAGVPYNLSMVAELQLKLGQFQEGMDTVREALDWAETTGERLCEAELHRLYGELLWADGQQREARARFLRALRRAREQGAGLFELRAAVSLGRLLREQGRPRMARWLLERTCARVGVSPNWRNFQETRELLAELPAPG